VEKKKNKKVNHLKLKECEAILERLSNQKESHYYQDVLLQYRKMMPAHRDAMILANTPVVSGVPFSASYEHNH
jgi:hypothetical protein